METDVETDDTTGRDLGLMLIGTLAILLVLTLMDVWRASTWWASTSDLAAVSPVKTALLLVLAPVVAVGTLLAGLRGPDAWRSGRTRRAALYLVLGALAFVGCIVLPGTDVGRDFVAEWLRV